MHVKLEIGFFDKMRKPLLYPTKFAIKFAKIAITTRCAAPNGDIYVNIYLISLFFSYWTPFNKKLKIEY